MDYLKVTERATGTNKRRLNRYGIVPNRGTLLHYQLEGRNYFDSGGFALMQPHNASDMGNIATGMQPVLEIVQSVRLNSSDCLFRPSDLVRLP
ncbi:uncharacterized protein B0J16DRAFT_349638 [Fusarium flagelliforme]|uniref:uncharacterized protein n=1 Tax=Fusarium flagelliforme TaxID=2675880 RepID=UPI001E8E0837|nr:uncharacterized protein B0J16DRAFT_349638 [Fusarium flagelliforme]KAH7175167.1 hypothetical protein B0J16DRAFT_349638 [Fusarium flagelliforme]